MFYFLETFFSISNTEVALQQETVSTNMETCRGPHRDQQPSPIRRASTWITMHAGHLWLQHSIFPTSISFK